MRLLALLAFVAACNSPPLSLRFRLTDGDSQSCVGDNGNATTKCDEITLACPAVLSVRIVPPNDPTVPYISVCEKMQGAQETLCSISRVSLPEPTIPIPEQILEVQMAVFPESAVPRDPVTKEYLCPPVEFAATGFPVTALPGCTEDDPGTCPKVPAVGGRAYYYPGDDMTVVTLGCSDLDQQLKGAACSNDDVDIPVKVTVKDFDSTLNVDQAIANRLTVSIGEPAPLGTEWTLFPQDARELARTAAAVPSWAGTLDFPLMTTRCIVVLEDGAQATSTLQCANVEPHDAIEIGTTGVRLSRATLTQLLAAINQTTFPDAGLTIGIVLDASDNPAAGLKVTATPPAGLMTPTIQYLAANRMSANETQTSSNGIFIVQSPAPYGTLFSVPDAKAVLGGNVQGKVTIVVIHQQLPDSG